MKAPILYLLICSLFLTACQSKSQSTVSQDRIEIHIPSAREEAEYIWQTLRDIPFFEQNGYQVSLPQGPLIEELKKKSKAGRLSDGDLAHLQQFVQQEVYRREDYLQGYEKIQQASPLLNKMVSELDPEQYPWDFKEFETYVVNLTLYGPGGSFDPDRGSILIYTTPDGRFKQYADPANTIIHEIIHIGIDRSIVAQYNVPHPLKERIVDTMVSLLFGKYLPDYRIQDMGEYRSDEYLKEVNDIKDLETIVTQILSAK